MYEGPSRICGQYPIAVSVKTEVGIRTYTHKLKDDLQRSIYKVSTTLSSTFLLSFSFFLFVSSLLSFPPPSHLPSLSLSLFFLDRRSSG